MKIINDGGPAFPAAELDIANGHYEGRYEILRQHPGMTLRDHFAGVALQGMYANPLFDSDTYGRMAERAYQQADAMLVEQRRAPIV